MESNWQERFEAQLIRLCEKYRVRWVDEGTERSLLNNIDFTDELEFYIQKELDNARSEGRIELLEYMMDMAKANLLTPNWISVVKGVKHEESIQLQERQRILGLIEGMKRTIHGQESSESWRAEKEGWNQALEELKEKIKE